jgi:hypothetical protein
MSNIKKQSRLAKARWTFVMLAPVWSGCGILRAATYFVAPEGNDSRPGSISAPFKTIARAYRKAAPGDTIVLKDGVYGNPGPVSDGSGGMHGYTAQIVVAKAGTPKAWITIKALNKGKAILNCETNSAELGCDKNVYLSSAAAYWWFEDLVFTGGAFGGIGTDQGASHIRVTGCEFSHVGNWDDRTQIGEAGIGFDRAADDWWIEGNVFHDIGRITSSGLDHGIYAAGSDVTVTHNVFYSLTHGWAIQLSNDASNWTIANNTFAFPNPSRDGQIMLWNNNRNITIRNNIFFQPRGFAIARYNSALSGCSVDHNLVYGASGVISDPRGCVVSGNQVGPDPLFRNISAPPLDFHLRAGSPAIRSGDVDLGAYASSEAHP